VPPPGDDVGGRSSHRLLRGVRPVVILAGVIMAVAALYLARPFLMPLAVAWLLTFLLSPVVRFFERRLPRIVAVILVVVLAFSILGALAWALALQAASLGEDIPSYRDHLKHKIAEVRGASQGNVIEKVQSATKEVVEELQKDNKPVKPADKPVPVVVKPAPALWQLPAVLDALGNVGFVLFLVIFMLIDRLQLRDRLIRVIGFGRIATTTKAMDEAAQRISEYLTRQTLINGTFGLGVALGALAIGLPYAFLWGALAGVLRFMPYVGPWAAALIVSLVGLAVFDGWLRPVLVMGLFVTLELFTSFVMETYLYSRSAGVSQVALLMAMAFWTWVWGPVGLALATPLTVCLVVLAKHVPDLQLVTVLLSDEPVMGPDQSYYQRLVAHDESNATQLVHEYAAIHPEADAFDEILVPALNLAARDHECERITDVDMHFVVEAIRGLLEELGPSQRDTAARRDATRLLGLAAHGQGDEVTLRMLERRLDASRFTLEIASPHLLVSEVIALVEQGDPTAVVIGALAGAGDGAPTRLVKRLRARFPDLQIVLGLWGMPPSDAAVARKGQLFGGADRLAVTLSDACGQLQSLWPFHPAAPAASAAAVDPVVPAAVRH
jgi:predicted PurR-regulated permease PerM